MAEKTVAVRLIALTNQYKSALTGATQTTARFGGSVTAMGGRVSGVFGGPMGIATTVGLAGAAVAKLALDYDEAFTRINAVTNASQGQVNKWRDDVLKLGGETAQSPRELAEGLYFLASAGLDSSEIMPTLEASAKAAAVGLGEMGDITRIVTNVMNAFPEAGLEATQVLDTMVAAIREGSAEPDEFADALGRVLPIAHQAGIGFEEIAASLATLSNIGLDVPEGVTAIRGVLNALVAPGTQASEAMAQVGLSADELRDSLANKGLIQTLRDLDEATGGNMELMRQIIPNVRALTGAFGLTGQEARKVNRIFREVADSSGSLGSAFAETAESKAFKFNAALADLEAAGIEIGTEVLPAIVAGLEYMASVIGPLADLVSNLTARFEEFGVKTPEWLRGPAGEFVDLMIPIDDVIGGLNKIVGGANRIGDEGGDAIASMEGNLRALRGPTGDVAGGLDDVETAADGAGGALGEAATAADDLKAALDELTGVALEVEEATLDWEAALDDMTKELKDGKKSLDVHEEAGRKNRESIKAAAEAAIDHAVAIARETGSAEAGERALRKHIDALIDDATKAGLSESAVRDYIEQLNLTPRQIRTLIQLNAAQATSALDRWIQRLNDVPARVYTELALTESREGGGVGHAGGIAGSLHARRAHSGVYLRGDEFPAILQRGEGVLRRSVMQSVRQLVGAPTSEATAARSGDNHVHFHGPVYGLDDFDRRVEQGLANAVRRAS